MPGNEQLSGVLIGNHSGIVVGCCIGTLGTLGGAGGAGGCPPMCSGIGESGTEGSSISSAMEDGTGDAETAGSPGGAGGAGGYPPVTCTGGAGGAGGKGVYPPL